jgi:hypothetical protein
MVNELVSAFFIGSIIGGTLSLLHSYLRTQPQPLKIPTHSPIRTIEITVNEHALSTCLENSLLIYLRQDGKLLYSINLSKVSPLDTLCELLADYVKLQASLVDNKLIVVSSLEIQAFPEHVFNIKEVEE